MKPQAEMLAPLTDLSFGPEGHEFDVCGRILNEAPESARKFFPERLSGKKIRFELAATLQAVADAGKTTIVGRRRRGARRRLPSLGRCRAAGSCRRQLHTCCGCSTRTAAAAAGRRASGACRRCHRYHRCRPCRRLGGGGCDLCCRPCYCDGQVRGSVHFGRLRWQRPP